MRTLILLSIIFSFSALAESGYSINLSENNQYILGINHLKKWYGEYKDCKEVKKAYSSLTDLANKFTLQNLCEGGIHYVGNEPKYLVDDPKCEENFKDRYATMMQCLSN